MHVKTMLFVVCCHHNDLLNLAQAQANSGQHTDILNTDMDFKPCSLHMFHCLSLHIEGAPLHRSSCYALVFFQVSAMRGMDLKEQELDAEQQSD